MLDTRSHFWIWPNGELFFRQELPIVSRGKPSIPNLKLTMTIVTNYDSLLSNN